MKPKILDFDLNSFANALNTFWDYIRRPARPLGTRQIISGVVYDTSEADQVAYYRNTQHLDVDYTFDEWGVLYRKSTDRTFFLHTNYTGNPKIQPVEEDEAKQWLEKHNLVDEYLDLFVAKDATCLMPLI